MGSAVLPRDDVMDLQAPLRPAPGHAAPSAVTAPDQPPDPRRDVLDRASAGVAVELADIVRFPDTRCAALRLRGAYGKSAGRRTRVRVFFLRVPKRCTRVRALFALVRKKKATHTCASVFATPAVWVWVSVF